MAHTSRPHNPSGGNGPKANPNYGPGNPLYCPAPLVCCRLCNSPGHSALHCLRRRRPSAFVAKYLTTPFLLRQPYAYNLQAWLMDSGASHHVTPDLANIPVHSEYDGKEEVHIGDGSCLRISHEGISYVKSPSATFVLSNMLCVPGAVKNVVSVHQFTKSNDVSVEFFPTYFVVKDRATGAPMARGVWSDGGYHLYFDSK